MSSVFEGFPVLKQFTKFGGECGSLGVVAPARKVLRSTNNTLECLCGLLCLAIECVPYYSNWVHPFLLKISYLLYFLSFCGV